MSSSPLHQTQPLRKLSLDVFHDPSQVQQQDPSPPDSPARPILELAPTICVAKRPADSKSSDGLSSASSHSSFDSGEQHINPPTPPATEYSDERVSLTPLAQDQILPFQSRPEEMKVLVEFNSAFFDRIGARFPQEYPMLFETWTNTSRQDVSDLELIARTKRVLINDESLWSLWCDVVGLDASFELEEHADSDIQKPDHEPLSTSILLESIPEDTSMA